MIEIEELKKKYELRGSKGAGAFGSVFEVILPENGEKRAVKLIIKQNIIDYFVQTHDYNEPTDKEKEALFDEVNEEINNMIIAEGEKKDNKNTVKYYEKFEDGKQIAIVMELCDFDLLSFFYKIKKVPFNDKEIYELLIQLNNTFKIMHENKRYHRDLSLNNILIKIENDKKIYKLSDYGVSKKLATLKNNKFSTEAGKPNYMAPEVKKKKYDGRCDLWSLGIIIYILIKKKNPSDEIIDKISTIELTTNADLNNLIQRLLVKDPNKRLNWDEYFEHPFFSKNKIIIKLRVTEKNKINNEFKDINILENEYYLMNDKPIKYQEKEKNKELEDLNENNIKLFINYEQVPFKKSFKPTKIGEYEIQLIFKKKMKNLSYLFRGCENIISIDLSSFDSSECINMKYMFGKCTNLEVINLTNLNTSNVTDMSYMFNKCKKLKNIRFPKSFNIEKVENMAFMFHQCIGLSSIEFPISFSKNNLKNICGLFGKCNNLTKIDLTNLKTENVDDMSFMFDQCFNLETIVINPDIFISKKVTKMSNMFYRCYKLKRINLKFNPENANFTSFMFNECSQLEEVDLSKMKINENANIVHMFDGCENLKIINLSSFVISDKNTMNNMFDNLKKIEKIIVNKDYLNEFKKNFKSIESKFSTN